MKKLNWKDILVRSIKTFIQTFISITMADVVGVDFIQGENLDNVLIGIFISAGAASISAVWNIVLSPLLDTKTGGNNDEVQ